MATNRSEGTGPTYEQGFTVFTATHSVEGNASSVRVASHFKGEKEKGCIDNSSSGFIDQLIHSADQLFTDIFAPSSNAAQDRLEKFKNLKCASVIVQLKIVVDGTETVIGNFSDYRFDAFDRGLEKTFGSELNGKVVIAKLSVATNMNKNNSWKVWVESTTPT